MFSSSEFDFSLDFLVAGIDNGEEDINQDHSEEQHIDDKEDRCHHLVGHS